MTEVFIIVWSGGSEAPQYEAKLVKSEAMALAEKWAENIEEGVDTIDVLRLDLVTLTCERVER